MVINLISSEFVNFTIILLFWLTVKYPTSGMQISQLFNDHILSINICTGHKKSISVRQLILYMHFSTM